MILGLGALVCSAFSLRPESSQSSKRLLIGIALLFPVYVAFQLVPLPLFLVRLLDPARAELADALRGFGPALRFAPLSITPGRTWVHLERIVCYTLVFLLVRAAARRTPKYRWGMAAPLIAIAGLEAVLGLVQHWDGASSISGTYVSKDHFVGLLEMVLPLAALYGVTILNRGRDRLALKTSSVLLASGMLALAAAMVAAIVFGLSKAGFLATLGSVSVVGMMALASRFSGGKRWAAVGLAVPVLLVFLYLAPNELVSAFGTVSSDPTGEGRWPIAKDTLHFFADYPVLGAGLGTFPTGLLRYETWGFQVGWANAHNDYFELLAELGIVGFLIPAALMCLVLARAVRTAFSGEGREERLLGLACTGGIVAILIHSVADFNMYIPANAMALSWIAGISAALPGRRLKPPLEAEARATRHTLPVRGAMLVLGFLGTIYAGGWLVYEHSYKGNISAEQKFCRFGICDSDGAFAALVQQRGDATHLTQSDIVEFIRRDPAGPNHWCDLGLVLQKAGRLEDARFCFSRALVLAPRIPYMLYRNGLFHFSLGENQTALGLMVHAMEGNPDYDRQAFTEYERWKIPVGDVLSQGLPAEAAAWRSYMQWQTEKGRIADAIIVWNSIVARGYANDALASSYVDFLIGKKDPEAAQQAWVLYAGGRAKDYPRPEGVFNGGFESDPSGVRFDWGIEARAGAAIDFDSGSPYSGARSLRIRFDGTENLTAVGISQTVFLKPGAYRFRAYVRAEGIDTDQGIAFNLIDEEDGKRLNVTSEAVLGSTASAGWKLVEVGFRSPAGTRLVRIRMVRKGSAKFDNKVKGTLWVDQVSLRAPEMDR